MPSQNAIVPTALISQKIFFVRGTRIMLDAVQVNVAIMRTFVHLREMLATHEELRRKIDAMEKR
jgi:hypothetical protein